MARRPKRTSTTYHRKNNPTYHHTITSPRLSPRKHFPSTTIPTTKIAPKLIIEPRTIKTLSNPEISLNLLDLTTNRCLNNHTQRSTNTLRPTLRSRKKIKRGMNIIHSNTYHRSPNLKLRSSYTFQQSTITNIVNSYSQKKLLSFISNINSSIVCPFMFYLNTLHNKIEI